MNHQPTHLHLGLYLKEKRIQARLNQQDLADQLNIHSQSVSNWERGMIAPPAHCFHKVLEVLKADHQQTIAAMLEDYKKTLEEKVLNRKFCKTKSIKAA